MRDGSFRRAVARAGCQYRVAEPPVATEIVHLLCQNGGPNFGSLLCFAPKSLSQKHLASPKYPCRAYNSCSRFC